MVLKRRDLLSRARIVHRASCTAGALARYGHDTATAAGVPGGGARPSGVAGAAQAAPLGAAGMAVALLSPRSCHWSGGGLDATGDWASPTRHTCRG
jgi:hypothetical protein